MKDLPPEVEAELSEEERELLDIIAPKEEALPESPIDPSARADENELVQGCASCGYNPDACGCGKYRNLMDEEDLWQ